MNRKIDTNDKAQRGEQEGGPSPLGFDRKEHLAELTNRIEEWKRDAQRYEDSGQSVKARVVRSWIKSAVRVAKLLRGLEGA